MQSNIAYSSFFRRFSSNSPHNFYIFKKPLTVVSPGPQPKTRLAILSTVESGCETVFYPEDQVHVDKQGWPLVVAYNGKDHYQPTLVVNKESFSKWQLECVAKLSRATLQVVHDVDMEGLSPPKAAFLKDLQVKLSTAVNIFSPTGSDVPPPSTSRARAVYFGGPQAPDAPTVPSGTPSEPGRKLRKCKECDYECCRGADFKSHLALAHGIGELTVCTLEDCWDPVTKEGKPFFNKSSLRLHILNIHKKKYKYTCKEDPDCKFRCNTEAPFVAHLAKKHAIGGESHECPNCNKVFLSKIYLQKHEASGMCKVMKNFQCQECGKWFKSKDSLQHHIKVFHTHEEPKVACSICQKEFASQKGLDDHMVIHRGLAALAQSKKRVVSAAQGSAPPEKEPRRSARNKKDDNKQD